MKMKRMRGIAVCLVFALALAFVPQLLSAAQTPPAPYGDLNGDGRVHADDARIALQAAARLIETTDTLLYYGDIDGNGKISATDARRILRAAARLESLPERQGSGETAAPTAIGDPTIPEQTTKTVTPTAPTESAPPTESEQTTELITPTAPTEPEQTTELVEPTTSEQPTELVEPTPPEQTTETHLPESPDFGDVYLSFASRLLKTQYALDRGKNVMLSPLSVMTALAMTESGAKGETLAQIEKMFGADVATMREKLGEYLKNLPVTEKSKLVAANSIWYRENAFARLSESFLDGNRAQFGAEVIEAPFDDGTVGEINAWCDKNTDGMIKKIIDCIDPNDVMYLINALTFDAEWAQIYNAEEIGDAMFTNADGTETTVGMMYSEESKLIDTPIAEGFVKPYADGKYSFAAVLPKGDMTAEGLIDALDAQGLSEMISTAADADVDAGIPKFESEYSCAMKKTLVAMGMTDAFDIRADLSGIGEAKGGHIYISDVIHKTFISVDERGTRAGAVTAVIARAESERMARRIVLDRPFVYMIVENASGLPAFIGVVNAL